MGNQFSEEGPIPLYERSVAGEKNYDYWGFKPTGLKPSQHVWHTYFAEPDGAAIMNSGPHKPDPNVPWKHMYGLVNAVPEMILDGKYTSYNSLYYNEQGSAGGFPSKRDVWPGEDWWKNGVNANGVIQQPKTTWWDTWVNEQRDGFVPTEGNPLPICTPANFPHCTMKPITSGEGITEDFSGKFRNSAREWEQVIDRLYTEFYVNGNVDELSQINTEDTSTYDPCDSPGFIARFMPILLGGLTGALFQRQFAPDLRNTLSTLTMNTASLGSFTFGFFYMRAAMDVFGSEDWNIWLASTSLMVPLGLALGDVWFNKGTIDVQNNAYFAGLAVSMILINPALSRSLHLPGPLNFVVHLIGGIFNAISTFMCRFVSPKPDNCTLLVDKNRLVFPEARRWDAASIAAMLTEEVRAEEGWERDDPRCEFAYKAFLTGPALLDAARPVNSSVRPMWEQGLGNPVGSIYAPQALQRLGRDDQGGQLYGHGQIWGWDGSSSGWMDVANTNNYACQNWDILRGNKNPGNQTTESRQLKETFDTWVKAVRDAAQDPNNLIHAGVGKNVSGIPGWKQGAEGFEPLRKALTDQQAMGIITMAYEAIGVQARYDVVKGYQANNIAPDNNDMNLWLQANENIYTYLALKPGKTVEDVWLYIQGFTYQQPQQRSAFIYAVTATVDPDLWAYWDKSPPEMKQAAMLFPPPAGLPFGLTSSAPKPPVNLGPPQHHWHWSTPLEPVQGGQSLCAEFLGKLRGTIDDPNTREWTPFRWQQACKQILGQVNPKICTACSFGQVSTIFAYSVFFDAYDNAGAGVGWFCDQLKNKYKWSDLSVAAALQNLQTPLDYNSNLKNFMTFWWGQYEWASTNWYEYVQNALKVEGAHYDESANVCGEMTSLTPLKHVEQPLTDQHLSRLYDPVSERPQDFKGFVTNVAGHFYKLFTGETPISSLVPDQPQALHWQDNEWSRHVYHPLPPGWDPGFPVPIHWDNPPPDFKHLQAPPAPPSPPYPLPTHIYWPEPPPDFKSLHNPPPPPGHITPFPLPMDPLYPAPPDPTNTDYCGVIFDALQNPPNAQWTNLTGTQMRTILAPMFTLQSCTDCEWTNRMNLWMYYIVNPQGQVFANGVGNWIDQNTNPQWIAQPWSDDALSAGLHVLQQPLHNQENLSAYISAFMAKPVASDGTDYTAKIKQLLQSPGNWDRTPGFCGP